MRAPAATQDELELLTAGLEPLGEPEEAARKRGAGRRRTAAGRAPRSRSARPPRPRSAGGGDLFARRRRRR